MERGIRQVPKVPISKNSCLAEQTTSPKLNVDCSERTYSLRLDSVEAVSSIRQIVNSLLRKEPCSCPQLSILTQIQTLTACIPCGSLRVSIELIFLVPICSDCNQLKIYPRIRFGARHRAYALFSSCCVSLSCNSLSASFHS